MEEKEKQTPLEAKEQEMKEQMGKAVQLAVDIARLRKILSIKQNTFNKLDQELYEYFEKNVFKPESFQHENKASESESTQENS